MLILYFSPFSSYLFCPVFFSGLDFYLFFLATSFFLSTVYVMSYFFVVYLKTYLISKGTKSEHKCQQHPRCAKNQHDKLSCCRR